MGLLKICSVTIHIKINIAIDNEVRQGEWDLFGNIDVKRIFLMYLILMCFESTKLLIHGKWKKKENAEEEEEASKQDLQIC